MKREVHSAQHCSLSPHWAAGRLSVLHVPLFQHPAVKRVTYGHTETRPSLTVRTTTRCSSACSLSREHLRVGQCGSGPWWRVYPGVYSRYIPPWYTRVHTTRIHREATHLPTRVHREATHLGIPQGAYSLTEVYHRVHIASPRACREAMLHLGH